MSAADALIRATISALSASFRTTGPLAALMYSVLPSTLSRVPATRCVAGCCADALEIANTAARAAAVKIRMVLISFLPLGSRAAEHTPIDPPGEAGAEGGSSGDFRKVYPDGDGAILCVKGRVVRQRPTSPLNDQSDAFNGRVVQVNLPPAHQDQS